MHPSKLQNVYSLAHDGNCTCRVAAIGPCTSLESVGQVEYADGGRQSVVLCISGFRGVRRPNSLSRLTFHLDCTSPFLRNSRYAARGMSVSAAASAASGLVREFERRGASVFSRHSSACNASADASADTAFFQPATCLRRLSYPTPGPRTCDQDIRGQVLDAVR